MSFDMLHRSDLPEGGFAGVREYRLVEDSKAFGDDLDEGVRSGLGNFVYLADARFIPKGETRMHNHREVDVISIMMEGVIVHEGSLEHGQELVPFNVQVQRAGGEGFSHNEINPDDTENRLIQIWVLPEEAGQPAGYKLFDPKPGQWIRVYGGDQNQTESFVSRTILEVGLLEKGQKISIEKSFLAYLAKGRGTAGERTVQEGDLMRGKGLEFQALAKTLLIVVQV